MQLTYVKHSFFKTSAQCGLYYNDKKGVIFGQYYSLSKKLAKIGDFHKSGFESSIEVKSV